MCGICGFVGDDIDAAALDAGTRMRDVLKHRGPDGAGERSITAEDGRLEGWFGHRRLKIIDLTDAADQPMASDDGSVVLNYNGEVYNFRELRGELERAGRQFRSTGDTEVVLRSYEEWGIDFAKRLEGMFALALWDARRRKLLLVRDRTGKKPLFYTLTGGRLTYGSEIKSLLAAPWVETGLDEARIPELLTFGYVPNPATLYKGILQVPPASIVTFTRGSRTATTAYWDPLSDDDTDVTAYAPKEVSWTVARLLSDATKRRMISDVPLGALLSGGIDSSLIVGLMAQFANEPVRTFTIGFPEEPSFDERPYARLVAEHFATRHTELAVRIDAVGLIDTLLWHHDQPYADSSALPTYLVCRLAREHVTVALNGDGGDEVFGGYDRFAAARISELVPPALSRASGAFARLLPRSQGYYSRRRRIERFAELADSSTRDRYQSWISVVSEELMPILMSPRIRFSSNGLRESMDRCYGRASQMPVLDQILYANFKTYLPDDLCVKMDRMSMATSLETRSPFLDKALVEYLARVPARRKVGLRQVKPLLRLAFAPLLPREIWNRKKHGFGVPLGRWFRNELGEMFEDEVLSPTARTHDLFNYPTLRCLWLEHQRAEGEHGMKLWTILMLEHWLRSLEHTPSSRPTVEPAITL